MAHASERRPTCQCSVRPDVLNAAPCLETIESLCLVTACARRWQPVGQSVSSVARKLAGPLIATLRLYRLVINREGPTTLRNLTVNGQPTP